MTPSLEQLALVRVREQFPALQRRGFATTLRSIFPDIGKANPMLLNEQHRISDET
jgi:hypothetical protein